MLHQRELKNPIDEIDADYVSGDRFVIVGGNEILAFTPAKGLFGNEQSWLPRYFRTKELALIHLRERVEEQAGFLERHHAEESVRIATLRAVCK